GRKAYEKNTEEYKRKLSELDKKFIDAVKKSKTKTMVFGDRFPLRYFIEDYKLNYYAAFVGCSAETEASFKTIAFLAGKVDEYKLNAIYKIETSDGKIAETIKNNTKTKNQKILTFDSMQSINSNDVKNKTTYIKIMEKNLDVVKKGIQ
ncbi:MAG: zinc ABC transporter substrate-binding protein, partial [Ruminococcus sp.]|nr:zinc ABC transporter substrate-binding protein [Ruminococcus sp.]